MRTETTTFPVEFSETTYSCDEPDCSFSTKNKTEADDHYGKKHAAKGTFVVGDEFFKRFDTEADMRAYAKAFGGLASEDAFGAGKAVWADAGWYRIYYRNEPCPRGCCRRDQGYLQPAQKYLIGLREQLEQLSVDIQDLESRLNLPSPDARE